MKKFEYNYSKKDLLESPEKYQMSPYFGEMFLSSYFKSRNEIIKKLEKNNCPSFNLIDIISILHPNLTINKFEKLEHEFNTEELLCFILLKIRQGQFNIITRKILNKLITKFEIKKRLFLSYNPDFKNLSGDFSNLMNYFLLSLICLMVYESTTNLKYLNTSLKLNDIICSQQQKLSNDIDISLGEYILKKETRLILNLCKNKGIELNW